MSSKRGDSSLTQHSDQARRAALSRVPNGPLDVILYRIVDEQWRYHGQCRAAHRCERELLVRSILSPVHDLFMIGFGDLLLDLFSKRSPNPNGLR